MRAGTTGQSSCADWPLLTLSALVRLVEFGVVPEVPSCGVGWPRACSYIGEILHPYVSLLFSHQSNPGGCCVVANKTQYEGLHRSITRGQKQFPFDYVMGINYYPRSQSREISLY